MKTPATPYPRTERVEHLLHEVKKLLKLQRHFANTTGDSRRVRLLRAELDWQQGKVKELANDIL